MPRQARLDAPRTLHRVIIRGLERGLIVRDDEDRQAFVTRLAARAPEAATAEPVAAVMRRLTGVDITQCPVCHAGPLRRSTGLMAGLVDRVPPGPPPGPSTGSGQPPALDTS